MTTIDAFSSGECGGKVEKGRGYGKGFKLSMYLQKHVFIGLHSELMINWR